MAYIGWESGGTKLVVTISLDGRRPYRTLAVKRPPGNIAMQSLETLLGLSTRLLKETKVDAGSVKAIGFGFGGNIDSSRNRPLLCIHEAGWDNFPVAEKVKAETGMRLFLINDCDAAGLAEAIAGQDGGFSSLFYVTLGTGVGGAMVVNGELFQTSPFGNAEIGHLRVDALEIQCPCGSRGCVEAVCSGPGLLRIADAIGASETQRWKQPEDITEAFLKGSPEAQAVMQHFTKCLARGLASVTTLFNPDGIVLGGGLGSFVVRHLLTDLEEKVSRLTYLPFRRESYIREWTLREGAVSLGAILYAADRVRDDNARPMSVDHP